MLFSYSESLLDRELKACANETKHVNKDLPIYILNSFIFVNHHIGSWWTIRATDDAIFSIFYQLQSLSLPSHWMTQFFQAHVAIDLQSYEEGLERYSNLSQAGFSENKYILLQTALAQYHARGVVLSIQYKNRVCPNSCIFFVQGLENSWNFFSTCSLKTPNCKWNIIVVYQWTLRSFQELV